MICEIYKYVPDLDNRRCDSYDREYSGEYCIIDNAFEDESCMVKFGDGTIMEVLTEELKEVLFDGDKITVIVK